MGRPTIKELNQLKIELYTQDISETRKHEIINILEREKHISLLQDVKGEYGHEYE